MNVNRDDRRADEPVPAAQDPDPDAAEERPSQELPRRLRLGAAWRLPVILAAAELDEDEPEAR